jgi:hypothetical protein
MGIIIESTMTRGRFLINKGAQTMRILHKEYQVDCECGERLAFHKDDIHEGYAHILYIVCMTCQANIPVEGIVKEGYRNLKGELR